MPHVDSIRNGDAHQFNRRKKIIMRTKFGILMLVTMVIVVGVANFALAGYVVARVDGSTGAIQAKLVPAEFMVPAGQKAINLKYSYSDPKSGRTSTVLGKNIYCVTRGSYMVDASGKALPELPAGTYRFFVGGSPGASGSLAYDLISAQ